jgi:hypothetical protein
MRSLFAAALVLGLAACASAPPSDADVAARADPEADVRAVATWMTGTFSSAEQHAAAPDDYFDIRLVMVPVWTDRTDGVWLYVEQAVGDHLEAPYRQRVYRLSREGEGEVASDVYTLPGEAKRFAGAWRQPVPLADVKPEDLTLRAGCTVHLRRTADGAWEGGTRGAGCASELRGAKYATTEIRLEDGLLRAWDRGHTEAGDQVWGPAKGPYRFVRVSAEPPR